MQDGVFQALPLLAVSSAVCWQTFINRGRDRGVDESTWHQNLLIEVATREVDLAPTFINNRGLDHRIGGSTLRQHLLIEVATVAFAGWLGSNVY